MANPAVLRLSAKTLTYEALAGRIRRLVRGRPLNDPPTPELVCDVIGACRQLHREQTAHGGAATVPAEFARLGLSSGLLKGGDALELLDETLRDPAVRRVAIASPEVLRCLLVTPPQPSTDRALEYLREYAQRPSPAFEITTKELDVFYIALRTALLRREIDMAFELVDATAAHRRALPRFVPPAAATGFVLLAAGLVAGQMWPVAIAGLGAILAVPWLRGPRLSRVGWATGGPSVLQRLSRRRELELCNRIVVGWEELIDLNVSNFHVHHSSRSPDPAIERRIGQQLSRRGMQLRPNADEAKYLDYWSHAGAGFEWVEPDQDPADSRRTP